MPEHGASFVLAQNLCTVRTAVSTGDSFSTGTVFESGDAEIAKKLISERTFVVSMMSVQVFNSWRTSRSKGCRGRDELDGLRCFSGNGA
jgi:hypothetical protein